MPLLGHGVELLGLVDGRDWVKTDAHPLFFTNFKSSDVKAESREACIPRYEYSSKQALPRVLTLWGNQAGISTC